MSGALFRDVMVTFIFVGFSGAAVLFMLAFLGAMSRELRRGRGQGSEDRKKSSLTLVMLDRNRHKELAA
jgi:hypothetical protein